MVEKPSSKFYCRLTLRFPQCLPFRPKLPLSTLIVELVSRYRLSLARSKRRKKKNEKNTTNRRDADVTVVARGCYRIA